MTRDRSRLEVLTDEEDTINTSAKNIQCSMTSVGNSKLDGKLNGGILVT